MAGPRNGRVRKGVPIEEATVSTSHRTTPWFLFPLLWPFWLVGWVLKLTGRLLGVVLGLVFTALGIVLTLTVAGAIIGLPLGVLGVLLMVRSVF